MSEATIDQEQYRAIAEMMATSAEDTFVAQVDSVVARLESIIVDVKRARFAVSYGQTRSGVERAGAIAHALTWGLANCHLQQVIDAGRTTDARRAELAALTAQATL